MAENPEVIGQALHDIRAGEVGTVRLGGPGTPRWTAADLDRCEHGRHSLDHCFDCPNGPRNLFLLHPESYPLDARTRVCNDRFEVRIGTMVHGEPIWVTALDTPRQEGH